MLSSTGIKPSTSASGSQPSGNTKKDKIQQTPSSTQKNKVEAHSRKVKSSLKNKDCVVAPKGTTNVQHSKLNANSKLKCVECNGCKLSDNHDLYVLDFINNVNGRVKSKSAKKNSKRKVWKPTGKKNDSQNLGKLQLKADIDFDELTPMAFEHSSSGPAFHEITPATISSGLVPNPPPSTPFVSPSRSDWDLLFQPLFDELLTPPPSVDHPAPEVIALY
ncbi:hypothetical protein Tco_0973819 [Tanacetum coccineum]|uniref:Uncharacterized protein n=1 Tax=Tanacetum coccineum TaxID=301880 RepID=A0ABQ5E9V1_9ASTR